MGIDRIGPSGPARSTGASSSRDRSAPSPEAAPERVQRDRIDLSQRARDLAALPAEERETQIQHLRQQVADGTYRPDADDIAARMVDLGDV